MNFREATDELLAHATLEDLAKTLGVSVQALRQARAVEGTSGYRSPPEGWEKGVLRLAKAQERHFRGLAGKLGKP